MSVNVALNCSNERSLEEEEEEEWFIGETIFFRSIKEYRASRPESKSVIRNRYRDRDEFASRSAESDTALHDTTRCCIKINANAI